MNKLKILVASALCSLFVIGLAGCGDDNVEGSACTQATAENDCASSTATKYVCHKQGTAETCLRDCTDSGKSACTAQEKCVDSSNGRKACVPTTPAGGDDKKCGTATCKADEVCNKTDAANPKCEKKVEKKTYNSILIVDQSEGEACNQGDSGSDIAGVVIKNDQGTIISFYGSANVAQVTDKMDVKYVGGSVPDTAFTPDATTNCPFKGLDKNKEKTLVLGCGGKAIFKNQTEPKPFQTGDVIEIYEYDGKVCSNLPKSPDDKYAVYACPSKDVGVQPETENLKDCVLLAEKLSGFQKVTVK